MKPDPGLAVHWRLDAWAALDAGRLEAVWRVRQQVFVVEQACAYADIDGLDRRCLHLAAWPAVTGPQPGPDPGLPWAYARLLPPGVQFEAAAIGRVLSQGPGRGSGLADQLMRRAVQACEARWPRQGQALAAQAHLQGWYARFGFEPVGEPYDEDGIAHHDMRRPAGPLA